MKKILVIEDEQNVRESILDILNAEDFYALGAENGRVGVESANEFQPDLIICDVMMPELNGHEVLSRLRQNPKTDTVPFIFLTAKADKTDFRQGMSLGANDYLTKPFTHDELLCTIHTQLGKQEVINQHSQQKMDDLRHSINFALPQALNHPLEEISQLSKELTEDCYEITPLEIMEISEKIQASTNLLQNLIRNFLLVAKLETISTNPEALKTLRQYHVQNPEVVIADVASEEAKQFNRLDDLELHLQTSPVQISERSLKKIVEELVNNAIKFSAKGTQIKLFSCQSNEQFVLHVMDHGCGMTAEQITNIGALMQFENGLTNKQEGIGLGLAIARRLVELHGGELSIESIYGKQTIVRVCLPY